MAAMGAQAASQIEGNRMMQETVQRGMKGVEDFAARRQLAAARAQLGELNINDPDYGQKLSGLVMDNPLAFTNEKTAGVANYAFKQAANDFQSKRENEQRTALQAAEFNLRRDLANMETQSRMSLSDQSRNDQINALIFGKQDAALQNEEESLRAQRLLIADPEGQALIDKKLGFISNRRNSLVQQLRQGSAVPRQSYGAAPLPNDTFPPPTDLGNAPIYGEGNLSPEFMPEEGQTFGNAAQSDGLSGALFPAPNAPIVQGANAPVATPVFDPSFNPEVPPPAEGPFMGQIPMRPETPVAAPAAPAAQVTPSGLTLEEEQELNTIFSQTAAAKAKKSDDGMSASEYKADEDLLENIVGSNREVSKLRAEVESLKSRESTEREAMGKDPVGFSPVKIAAVNKLSDDRIAKEKELKDAENSIKLQARMEGPKTYIKREFEEARKQVKEKEKAEAVLIAAAAAGAPAAGAGTAAETPKKPVELNFFEQALLEEAPAKRKELEESSNQWAGAKQSIRGALGTGENGLEKIALEVFKADVLGKGLPFVKARLIERIANEVGGRIPQGTKNAPIKFGLTDTAFSQKSYRFGPNAVTWYEVIGTIADDLIGQYEKAQIGANAPTTNTALENKNPSLGAVSAIPVP
jgi:hypothetical protein